MGSGRLRFSGYSTNWIQQTGLPTQMQITLGHGIIEYETFLGAVHDASKRWPFENRFDGWTVPGI
jgi:hypothetical protein